MSRSLLERLSISYFQSATASLEVSQTPAGTFLIKGQPIFRAGTFKDSKGQQHTWEDSHLHQIVDNFYELRREGNLPHIPVRNDHRGLFGGGEVVGYIQNVYIQGRDAKGNSILRADFEITEPDAYEKIKRGTWRARSAEVGHYETNDETPFWPVLMGVAYVDLPAVEGLFSNNVTLENEFTPVRDEESAVPPEPTGSESANAEPPSGTAPGQAEQTEPPSGAPASAEQNEGGEGGEGGTSEHSAPEPTPPTPPAPSPSPSPSPSPTPSPDPSPGTPTQPNPPPSEHGQGGNGVMTFAVNGQQVMDHAAVQAHITALEQFRDETLNHARSSFIEDLASRHIIPATRVEEMTNFALSLNNEQWEQFRASYADAPPASLFAAHGGGPSEGGEPDSEGDIDTLKETVSLHRLAGMDEEKVKQTESYKRLQELQNS